MTATRPTSRRRVRRRIARARARARLRRVNLRRASRAALTQPPVPSAPAGPLQVSTSFGAPRTLLYVTVKRNNTSWRELYGHWWIEVDEVESYGWWPAAVPLRARDVLVGAPGVLNGMGLLGRSGSWTRDVHHGDEAMHRFHPVLSSVKSDAQVRADVRDFAQAYSTRWRWHVFSRRTRGTCRSFQDELFDHVDLVEPSEQLYTRGSGCPFLYRIRRGAWAIVDVFDAVVRPRLPVRETAAQTGG